LGNLGLGEGKEGKVLISSGPPVDLEKNSFRPTCLIPDVFL